MLDQHQVIHWASVSNNQRRQRSESQAAQSLPLFFEISNRVVDQNAVRLEKLIQSHLCTHSQQLLQLFSSKAPVPVLIDQQRFQNASG